jgi:hypothetical protein
VQLATRKVQQDGFDGIGAEAMAVLDGASKK